MALPAPGSRYSGLSAPSGGIDLRRPTGMDYTGRYRSGPQNIRLGRNLSTTAIANARENNPLAWYSASGQPVEAGTRIYNPGWNVRWGPDYYRRNSISSSGVAGGVPTSARNRESMMPGAGEVPSWQLSQFIRDQDGLSQSWRYGGMGMVKPRVNTFGDGKIPGPPKAPGAKPNPQDPWGDRTTYGNAQTPNPFSDYASVNPAPMNTFNSPLYAGTDEAYWQRRNFR